MKHLFAILSALLLLAFATPVFACDGHKSADKDSTTTASENADGEHACSADCNHEDKDKKVKKNTKSSEGEG